MSKRKIEETISSPQSLVHLAAQKLPKQFRDCYNSCQDVDTTLDLMENSTKSATLQGRFYVCRIDNGISSKRPIFTKTLYPRFEHDKEADWASFRWDDFSNLEFYAEINIQNIYRNRKNTEITIHASNLPRDLIITYKTWAQNTLFVRWDSAHQLDFYCQFSLKMD